ncbi:MAG: type I glyceraldehyde-3-phosphate dehydrogenase [Clostridia bacterium]|nr:type I glyceraldehyde-3-phosphate dehydrogenase [Clostridia bacterium]
MSIKLGLNGFGRIGRIMTRAAHNMDDIEIVGINDLNGDFEYLAYLLKYDTTFGRYEGTVEAWEEGLVIDGKKIKVFSCKDAKDIPWGELGAEYVVDATGVYTSSEKAMAHIEAGAKHVIISAPAKDKETPTFVCGVNLDKYTSDMKVVSNASCTTNCLAPMCKVLQDNWGIEKGLMATVHASTSKQKTVDAESPKDWRAGRSVYGNIIPSTTGAAKAVGLVIPELQGKMTGISYRIPAADVSLVDLNVILKKETTLDEIKAAFKAASQEGDLVGVIEYCDDEIVSQDFRGDAHTSIFDSKQGIQLDGKMFKLVAFYDNEFGYSTKLLELIRHMYSVDNK